MAGILALGLGLSACTGGQRYGIEAVDVPADSPRINAKATRAAQLKTGTTDDDIPEFTGAPGPDGRWPATTVAGRNVYRDVRNMEVAAEGPGADVSAGLN